MASELGFNHTEGTRWVRSDGADVVPTYHGGQHEARSLNAASAGVSNSGWAVGTNRQLHHSNDVVVETTSHGCYTHGPGALDNNDHPNVLSGVFKIGGQEGPLSVRAHLKENKPKYAVQYTGASHRHVQQPLGVTVFQTMHDWLERHRLSQAWSIVSVTPQERGARWVVARTQLCTSGSPTSRYVSSGACIAAGREHVAYGHGIVGTSTTSVSKLMLPLTRHTGLVLHTLALDATNMAAATSAHTIGLGAVRDQSVQRFDVRAAMQRAQQAVHWVEGGQHSCWDLHTGSLTTEAGHSEYIVGVGSNQMQVRPTAPDDIERLSDVCQGIHYINGALGIVTKASDAIKAYGPSLGVCTGRSVSGNRMLIQFTRGQIMVIRQNRLAWAHMAFEAPGTDSPTVIDSHAGHLHEIGTHYEHGLLVSASMYANVLGAVMHIIGGTVEGLHNNNDHQRRIAVGLQQQQSFAEAYGKAHSQDGWLSIDHEGLLHGCYAWRASHQHHPDGIEYDQLVGHLRRLVVYGRDDQGWIVAAGETTSQNTPSSSAWAFLSQQPYVEELHRAGLDKARTLQSRAFGARIITVTNGQRNITFNYGKRAFDYFKQGCQLPASKVVEGCSIKVNSPLPVPKGGWKVTGLPRSRNWMASRIIGGCFGVVPLVGVNNAPKRKNPLECQAIRAATEAANRAVYERSAAPIQGIDVCKMIPDVEPPPEDCVVAANQMLDIGYLVSKAKKDKKRHGTSEFREEVLDEMSHQMNVISAGLNHLSGREDMAMSGGQIHTLAFKCIETTYNKWAAGSRYYEYSSSSRPKCGIRGYSCQAHLPRAGRNTAPCQDRDVYVAWIELAHVIGEILVDVFYLT